MEVRGRNGKWLGTGNGRTVRVVGVVVVYQLSPQVRRGWGGMDAFVVVDVVERRVEVGHHEYIGGKNRGRSRRGSINRKEGADCGELTANFFFLNVEELSDVYNYLLVGESQIAVGGAVWRRRGDEVGGVASAFDGRRRAGGNEDGRR